MPPRLRKFIGMLLLIALVIVWAIAGIRIGVVELGISDAHVLWQMLFYVVGGIGWVLPAMLVIRWMEKVRPGNGDA